MNEFSSYAARGHWWERLLCGLRQAGKAPLLLVWPLFLSLVFIAVQMSWAPDVAAQGQPELNDSSLQAALPGNWKWVGGGCFEDAFFIDNENGWAVGQVGVIVHTSDGGATWIPQQTPRNVQYNSVYFVTKLEGWVVGGPPSTILHTSDGGATWAMQNTSTWAGLNAVYFVDAQKGWAVGQGGVIVRTTDGGLHWAPQASGTSSELRGLFFWDANRGWAVGDGGTILQTTNGGQNWRRYSNSPSPSRKLYAVYFVDADKGWIVGEGGTVLHTGDSGASWGVQPSGTAVDLHDVAFRTALRGWARRRPRHDPLYQ